MLAVDRADLSGACLGHHQLAGRHQALLVRQSEDLARAEGCQGGPQAGGSDHRWVEPVSGFTHGRSAEWSAAAGTALDHPVAGAGADAYLPASAGHQGDAVTLYAHNLPLEAWAELGPLGLALVLGLYASAGTLPTTLATGQKSPLGIAADANYVFWAAYGTNGQADGAIMKLVKQP